MNNTFQMLVRSSSVSSLSSTSPSSSEQQVNGSSNRLADKFKLPSSETILPGEYVCMVSVLRTARSQGHSGSQHRDSCF